MIVDDELLVLDTCVSILKDLGYQVTSCLTGAELLELFRSKPNEYDLVITDLTMPDMTGLELSEKIKKIRNNIPIILSTGFGKTISTDKAYQKGISEVIFKPFSIKQISNVIHIVLHGDKAKTGNREE